MSVVRRQLSCWRVLSTSVYLVLVSMLAGVPALAQTADLRLTAQTDPPGALSVVAGRTISYRLTSFNAGPSTAIDVKIYEETPPGSIFLSATPSSGGSCSHVPIGVGFGAAITCTWSGGTLLNNARSLTVATQVCSEEPCGSFQVNDLARTWSSTPDPLPGNNMQTGALGGGLGTVPAVSTAVLTRSRLTVNKIGTAITTPGSTATYRIFTQNLGPSNAQVTVTDTLPPGWTVASVTVDPPFYSCSGVGSGTATCTLYLPGSAICAPLPSDPVITVVANVPPLALYTTYLNLVDISSSNCLADSGQLFAHFETEVRPVFIFSDGFESGTTSAWSVVEP